MRIIGTGWSVPKQVVTNPDLETRLGLELGWIERRTGIRQRPTAHHNEAASDLAIRAGEMALEASGLPRQAIGLLVLANSSAATIPIAMADAAEGGGSSSPTNSFC